MAKPESQPTVPATAPTNQPAVTAEQPAVLCPRCAADLQPENFGSPRRCAFGADGRFTADNWNCATLNALLGFAAPGMLAERRDDETIEAVPTLLDGEVSERHEDSDNLDAGGWYVFTRYKNRGRTSSAIHVGDFWPPARVTLAKVSASLSRYEAMSPLVREAGCTAADRLSADGENKIQITNSDPLAQERTHG